MDTPRISYELTHGVSSSKAIISYELDKNNNVKIVSTKMKSGKVISLASVKKTLIEAKSYFEKVPASK